MLQVWKIQSFCQGMLNICHVDESKEDKKEDDMRHVQTECSVNMMKIHSISTFFE